VSPIAKSRLSHFSGPVQCVLILYVHTYIQCLEGDVRYILCSGISHIRVYMYRRLSEWPATELLL
jgi:hypothetical protein